ncbi:MAG: hypothetical protein KA463_06240 [Flavobacterium sp.]|jgi:hypothetical protein|uniref:hypothetical protein n=1 Tax=Flavobacterium sp. TaxID=239 RepID=UPI001B44DBB0|nr:hypothetical protein [Flavobacterium sp.]MBP6146768.1 hypothetical protein [Flavobacterium sp.]MBP7182588.1 hypothetical protein [Flavobacterium sp.]MBP7316672.1 hypothetical protein [Flavobacterium sp.]HRM45421.1 hypothetical protein [Flavobacterium sp.]
MFESIINWMIANKDSLISNVLVSSSFIGISRLWIIRNKVPNVVKKLANIKGIKYLGFIVMYILPLGTIASMIIDKTNEPTFKNIALLILISVTLVYNILMNSIITIYKMISEILEINSKNFSKIDSYAGRVNSAIKELKEK